MRVFSISWAIIAIVMSSSGSARAADPQEITLSIQRGANYLLSEAQSWNTDTVDQGRRSLAALALYKAHIDPQTPAIANAVQAAAARCTASGYQPRTHHYYQAGIDANLLVEVGGENFQPQLLMIADYIIAGQLDNGGWDYPEGHDNKFNGDTSVTQYAILGLWAATRAGVEVPNSVFERAVSWHLTNQMPDGGFAYVPGLTVGNEQGLSGINLTAAAIGSVMIGALHLYPNQYDKIFHEDVQNEVQRPMETGRAGGVLETVDIDTPPEMEAENAPDPQTSIPITGIQQSMRRAAGWLGTRFVNYNQGVGHVYYYYYAVERAASLAGITTIGQHDWYNYCADYLLGAQRDDGSWTAIPSAATSHYSVQDTSFAILFLAKSTGQIIRTPNPPDPAGAGLLTGNRGLPDNLNDIQVMADGSVTVPPNLGPTSDLLAELTNIGEVNIEEVQQRIVAEIQAGENRETLVGQKDRLVELAGHPNAEVRRTAIWALGRTGDLSLAKLLIEALEDPDIGVNIEANNALCWLSRRPNGFNLSTDPLAGLPEDAAQDQKNAIMAAWRSDAIQNWGSWYLRHRPFADRGDEFEANLRQKLGR